MAGSVQRFGAGDHRYELVPGWGDLPEVRDLGSVSIAVDSAGRVHLFSRHSARKIVLDRDGAVLAAVALDPPLAAHGVLFDADDHLYLASRDDHVVVELDRDGTLLLLLGETGRATNPDWAGGYMPMVREPLARTFPPFAGPTDVAPAPDGTLYCTDGYGNGRVHHYSGDGVLLGSWGAPGRGVGEFHLPHAVWVHQDGRVFVADRENSRVQVFDGDGTVLGVWTDMVGPGDLCIDEDEVVYVAEGVAHDADPGRADVFVSIRTIDGEVLARWGGARGAVAHSLCVDAEGSIYVNQALGDIDILKFQRI
jgi:DNA-binding beta-propeller fold protein YncE